MNTPQLDHFLCSAQDLQTRIAQIDPRAYDKTRNYLNGDVTWLSPFLTHGIINTKTLASGVLQNNKPKSSYRFLFELGWREFFHRTWQIDGDSIFSDMRNAQAKVRSDQMPECVVNANTEVEIIDSCIADLKTHGVMHNHTRMWVAAITCNMAGTYWQEPARWLHYHLLDGDLASNTLSWQWISGTFSHKQYVANQGNIDKYSKTTQQGSWLDVPYEAFDQFEPPTHLLRRCDVNYEQILPGSPVKNLTGPVALRNVWHLDPRWKTDVEQHIVFIDSELAERWPMSAKRWQFIEHWASLCNATLMHGTVEQLNAAVENADVVRTEYPACEHWPGQTEEREWLYPMPPNTFNSFSQYFKQVKHHVGL